MKHHPSKFGRDRANNLNMGMAIKWATAPKILNCPQIHSPSSAFKPVKCPSIIRCKFGDRCGNNLNIVFKWHLLQEP